MPDAPELGLPENADNGIFVHDRVTGAVTLVSRTDGPAGAPFIPPVSEPAISADGYGERRA